MSPRRTTPTGAFRFNRDFTRLGVGIVQRSSKTTILREFRRRDALLTKLAENAQVELLRAFQDGRVTIETLVAADRQNRLSGAYVLADLVIQENLWSAIARIQPLMGRADASRKRYACSFDALRRKATDRLGPGASIADLAHVSWADVKDTWGRSAADWNHLRRAVSSFLTLALNDKYHPFRRAVMQRFPRGAEVGRVPDISDDLFWRVVANTPEHARAAYVTLVATGMRVGEYLRCTQMNLRPSTCSIEVPGTKNAASAAVIRVDERLWPYVCSAIPAPLGYQWLRTYWKRAAAAVGEPGLRLHDLRHCYGQWAVNEGVAEAHVQVALRHATASMTRRYTKQASRGEAARAVGNALLRVAR